jgi:hypothetical protein
MILSSILYLLTSIPPATTPHPIRIIYTPSRSTLLPFFLCVNSRCIPPSVDIESHTVSIDILIDHEGLWMSTSPKSSTLWFVPSSVDSCVALQEAPSAAHVENCTSVYPHQTDTPPADLFISIWDILMILGVSLPMTLVITRLASRPNPSPRHTGVLRIGLMDQRPKYMHIESGDEDGKLRESNIIHQITTNPEISTVTIFRL